MTRTSISAPTATIEGRTKSSSAISPGDFEWLEEDGLGYHVSDTWLDQDLFGFHVDTFNNDRNGFMMVTTPKGGGNGTFNF